MMHKVAISLGSNTVDAHEQILTSLNWLQSLLQECKVSSIYTTPALHGGSTYNNAVAIGNCVMELEPLKQMLKKREADCGRNEETRTLHQVPIDLDVVMWDEDIVKEKDFQQEYFTIGYDQIRN